MSSKFRDDCAEAPEWDLSRIVSDYGTILIRSFGEWTRIFINSELLGEYVLAIPEAFERKTTLEELLNKLKDGDKVVFTARPSSAFARPSSAFNCRFMTDAWALEESLLEGTGTFIHTSDFFGIVSSEVFGNVFFPIRSSIDAAKVATKDSKMSDFFKDGQQV